MNIKRNLIILCVISILTAGCTPYFLLDDKEKVERIIEKYVTLINKGDYSESFRLLTFIHQPESRNEKMYEMAQTLQGNTYNNIEYIVKEIDLSDNIADVTLDMVFSTTQGKARSIKVESQMYLYRPKESSIWFIVSGDQESRRVFYEKFIKGSEADFKVREDSTFISIDGTYIPQADVRFDENGLFVRENGEWVKKD
ncbi:MAG: hypothetical protein ACOCWO_00560 [Candidatus Muiribacteriaceae bacterium]